MNKKLLAVIGGTILSASLVTGCGVDNNDPAPPNDDGGNGAEINRNDRDNRIFNNNNDRGIFDNRNGRYDMNTDNDGDMMRDNNTPGEDPMEDRLDMNDRNNRDR